MTKQAEFPFAREARERDLMTMPVEKLEAVMDEYRRRHEAEVATWRKRTIALVSCGKRKRPERCRARDLYTGTLFRRASEYAEVLYGEWYIISALHNLLDPEDMVSPYERVMSPRLADRYRWALITANDIGARLKPGRGSTFVLLAGGRYTWPLTEILEARGYECETPLASAGNGIGARVGWLNDRLEKLRL